MLQLKPVQRTGQYLPTRQWYIDDETGEESWLARTNKYIPKYQKKKAEQIKLKTIKQY